MKTKHIYLSLFFLLTSFLFSFCSKFLEVTPTDFISPKNYFNTENDANFAIAGVYKNLNTLYGSFFKNSFSAPTDELAYSRLGADPMMEKTFNALTPTIETGWNQLYQGVYYANFFLKNIDKVSCSDTAKNSLRAEARFLRGYYYYHLTMLWGDVPLRMKPIDSPLNTAMARSPRSVVFDSICADMEYAIRKLYPYSQQKTPVRICKEGAIGVLARVYLSRAGILHQPEYYAKARDILKPLVDSKVIKLNPDYTQIWKNISADAFDNTYKEILFDIEFSADPTKGLGSGWAGNVAPAAQRNDNSTIGSTAGCGYNIPFFCVTPTMWKYYQSSNVDVRREWNLNSQYYNGSGVLANYSTIAADGYNAIQRTASKFRRDWEVVLPKDKNTNGSNFPALRYSDVLLMLSEADFEANGGVVTDVALAGVDSVRSRAKATLFSKNAIRPTPDQFRTIIREERARELCFESTTRYYDLMRWGILIDKFAEVGNTLKTIPITTKTYSSTDGPTIASRVYLNMMPYMLLFPIPYSEIQLNPLMTQNPNW